MQAQVGLLLSTDNLQLNNCPSVPERKTSWQHPPFQPSSPRRARAGSTRMLRAVCALQARFPPWSMAPGRIRSRSTVDPRIITKILHSDSGHNTIFDLDVTGSAMVKAMIVDWQHEPVKGALLHIDLKRIAMDKAMRVSVPVQLIGIPVGVKTQGGILEHVLREVEIECLPGDIPSHLDADVSRWRSTSPSTSPTCRTPARSSSSATRSSTVAHVALIKEEVVAVEAVVEAPAEPEVAKKGKGETEAAPDAKTEPSRCQGGCQGGAKKK